MLRSVLGWRDFDGRLQASGWAEQAPGKDWVGGTTVLLHEPIARRAAQQVPHRAHPARQQPASTCSPNRAMRATLDFDVDESTRVQGEAVAERRSDLLASPLRGRIAGTSEAIKVLPLLVPEIDRAAGRLDGQRHARRHARPARVQRRLPPARRPGRAVSNESRSCRRCRLDGTFGGDELKFDADGKTAQGQAQRRRKLQLAGRRHDRLDAAARRPSCWSRTRRTSA